MKNNNYEKPSMKMVTFDIEDVITTSGGGLNNKGDGTVDGSGSFGGEQVMPDPVVNAVMN